MINLNSPIQTYKTMSSALFIETKTRPAVRKKTLSQRIEFGKTSLTFFTVILIAVVSLVYLTHANQNATQGYVLKELEQSRAELLTKNEVLDMQIAEIKSLRSLSGDNKIASMVDSPEVLIIDGATAIASKN